MDNKNKNYIKTLISYIALLIITVIIAYVFTKILPKNSFGADSQTINLQANIKKYINYKISDQEKGTLLQYDVKTGIDYKEDEEQYIPVKQSQIKLEMNQIDNKYPYDVKVIARSTEATNGKKRDISELYRYNNETGILIIQASNVNENGELINKEKINKEAQDEYTVICNYDTYIEEAEQREIDIKAEAIVLLSEDNRMISKKEEFKGTVQNNIGELTSVEYVNSDIYNGNIKSNIINGTNYDTEYKETQKIVVSKKEAQDEIWIIERNSFINIENNQIETDLGNNGELLYKSTKLYKSNLVRLLGEEGTLEILDSEKNLIATIDKNTEYDKDGTKTINYQDNIESIIIKTSKIQNEGILELENTKAIKNTMRKTQNVKINTTTHLFGVKNVLKNNETIKEQVYRNEKENTIEIKDSTTDVRFDINKTEWTNKEQNELVFDISLNTSSIKNNLFKNPSIKIELPKEVEKVILGDSHIVYGNGLELRDVHVENDENGMINIIASIEGSQTTFNENSLGLNTNIKIPATVILKKDIQSEKENIKLLCTNDFTLDDNKEVINKNVDIEITSYQQEDVNNGEVTNQEVITTMLRQSVPSEIEQGQEKIEGLDLEVVPVKGDTVLKNGDTVYEGEFIKYNIKVTNTSDRQIDNIKIVGSIPEGTTYAELEADYNTSRLEYEEKYKSALEDQLYKYNYDESIKEKIIEVNSLSVGESKELFYEVRINDLDNGEQKEIETKIYTYINEIKSSDYGINNTIKQAEAKVFVSANMDVAKNDWNYNVTIESNKEVLLKLQVPKEFEFYGIVNSNNETSISEDNIITVRLTSGRYIFKGNIDGKKIDNQTENSKIELFAVATVECDDINYKSNENRILYEYENVSIEMTSDSEGEEIPYKGEINYKIKITNKGSTNIKDTINLTSINLKDYLPREIIPNEIIYENYEKEIISYDEDTNTYTYSDEFKKIIKKVDVNSRYTDTTIPDLDLFLNIPEDESINIIIKTTVDTVFEKTKIENSATITGNYILPKTSNSVSHIILPFDYSESDQNNPDNPDNPDNQEKSNNQDNTEETSDTKEKYSISGVAWFDINQDGQRQISEELLSGINVMLVDANNATNIQEKKSTNSNGEYIFSNLDKGSYIVVFDYDTNKYSLTDYQKEGVNSALNSDAMSKEITISGSKTKVGLTDSILLDASVKNIDVGLIKNKICDLKLDKYISKVTVNTASGVKEQSYERSQLAKVEIKSKEIQGATVLVEYKIVVTNEGEIPTSANKIIDYIPDGLQFSSELNKDWILSKTGELNNTSFSNTKIESGKSIELTLILTKSMTANSTGTFTNSAEIGEINNVFKINDTDSIAANKVETEDDYSKADLIISVSTGEFMYIPIILGIVLLLGIFLYINAKFGFKKISKILTFVMILFIIVFYKSNEINASYGLPDAYDGPIYFTCNNSRPTYFYDTINGKNVRGTCNMDGGNYGGSGQRPYYLYKWKEDSHTSSNSTSEEFILEKKNNSDEEIKITKVSNNYIIGPFKMRSNADNYSFEIDIAGKDKAISGKTCESNGMDNTISTNKNSTTTFYLKTATSNISEGQMIKKIKCIAKKKITTTTNISKSGTAYYRPGVKNGDSIVRYNGYDWPTYNGTKYQDVSLELKNIADKSTKTEDKEKIISWDIKYGNLQIEKIDKDNSNNKLSNVQFKVTGPSYPDGKIITTNNEGKTEELKNILAGKYIMEEISNTNYGYTTLSSKNVTVNAGMNNNVVLENVKDTGNLIIEKRDEYVQTKKLEGVIFKIRAGGETNPNKGKYVKITEVKNDEGFNSSTNICTGAVHIKNMTFVNNENDATKFVTDSNGLITIYNILKGYYEVEETSIGSKNELYDEEMNPDFVSWSFESMNQDWTKLNQVGHEVDKADAKKSESKSKVANIRVFKRSSLNTTEDKAISMSSEDKPYDYLIFNNRKKYIKVSGYAFEDNIAGKKSERNNKYDSEETDKRLAGITVKLYNSNGELIDTQITDSNGEYIFGDYDKDNKKIEIVDLEGAYIEFEYNGMSFETTDITDSEGEIVKANYASDNSSKAVENLTRNVDENICKTREDFNNKYAIIENNQAKTVENQNSEKLEYTYESNASKLIYGDNFNLKYGYEGQVYPISGVYSKYVMTANTYDADKDSGSDVKRLLGQNLTTEYILKNDVKEIQNMNLGLRLREQADIMLQSDLANVELEINNHHHIYNYGNRQITEYDISKDEDKVYFNVGVSFKSKYTVQYKRAIYEPDYRYSFENQNSDNRLKVYLTYQIAVYNVTTNLKEKVNSIIDYYDKDYSIEGIIALDDNGRIKENNIKYTEDNSFNNDKYNKIIIDTADSLTDINPEKCKSIFIKFKLNNEAVLNLLNKEEPYENIAEINSYSVFDKDGKIYAGIDKDSNPGNAEPGKEETYEDDIDYAPQIQLPIKGNRTISGSVFLDEPTAENPGGTAKMRLGNGIFDTGENGIKGVNVTLRRDDGTEFYAETGSDGGFTIKDDEENKKYLIPGNYTLIYTWGDEKYTIKDYKGTIWTEENKREKDQNESDWYKVNIGTRYSDAMDDWETRQKIDKDEKDDEGNIIEKMKSTTNKMDIDIELNIIEGDVNDDGVINTKDIELIQNYINKNIEFNEKQKSRADIDGNGLINIDDVSKLQKNIADVNEFVEETQEDGTVTLTQKLAIYQINNVDFGIVERARQQLDINKRVKSFKVTLANGQTIVDANVIYDEDTDQYKLKENTKYVTYMGPSKGNSRGLLKVEIDNELIQGATAEITYEIKVLNKSEKDYDSENYYLYGELATEETEENTMIKLKPTGVYDYYDKELSFNTSDNNGWEIIQDIHTFNEKINNKEYTLIEKALNEWKLKENTEDGNTIETRGYEYYREEYKQIITEWKSSSIRESRLKNKGILHNTGELERELEPGKSTSQDLKLSKVLSNSDEIDLNNDSEIIDIKRTLDIGRKVTITRSLIYDPGESVRITPPTGSTNKTLEIIIISISSLIILATGIIFIRKKVL